VTKTVLKTINNEVCEKVIRIFFQVSALCYFGFLLKKIRILLYNNYCMIVVCPSKRWKIICTLFA
jgi:hypothetical protein